MDGVPKIGQTFGDFGHVSKRAAGLVTVVPRLVLRGPWRDEAVELPDGRWRNVLSDETFDGGRVPAARLLDMVPVALLARGDAEADANAQ